MKKEKRTLLIIVVLIALVAISGILAMLKFARESESAREVTAQRVQTEVIFDDPRTIPSFTLQGADGGVFDNASLENHWNIVFFGYTHCPDICPTTLSTLNKVWEKLSESARADLQVVFISIDPKRDTPAKTAKYAAYFNPHFKGVTGDAKTLESLTQTLGVGYFEVPSNNKDYVISHTGSLMLFNPQGKYVGIISPPLVVDQIVDELEALITSESD